MPFIIQHSTDGLGHQLHGLFTLMCLHGIRGFTFDADSFIRKPFQFQHLTEREARMAKAYLIESVTRFKNENHTTATAPDRRHVSVGYEIFEDGFVIDEQVLYVFDNAYYFGKLNLSDPEKQAYVRNIRKYFPYFVNHYVPKKTLPNKSIVIHHRLGDVFALGRETILYLDEKLEELCRILHRNYPAYHIYVHTNGTTPNFERFLRNARYCKVFGKKTNIMNVLSDFLFSDIFVSNDSGLSAFCCFINNKELIVENSYGDYRFGGYLSTALGANYVDLVKFMADNRL